MCGAPGSHEKHPDGSADFNLELACVAPNCSSQLVVRLLAFRYHHAMNGIMRYVRNSGSFCLNHGIQAEFFDGATSWCLLCASKELSNDPDEIVRLQQLYALPSSTPARRLLVEMRSRSVKKLRAKRQRETTL